MSGSAEVRIELLFSLCDTYMMLRYVGSLSGEPAICRTRRRGKCRRPHMNGIPTVFLIHLGSSFSSGILKKTFPLLSLQASSSNFHKCVNFLKFTVCTLLSTNPFAEEWNLAEVIPLHPFPIDQYYFVSSKSNYDWIWLQFPHDVQLLKMCNIMMCNSFLMMCNMEIVQFLPGHLCMEKPFKC